MPTSIPHRCWAEINLQALRTNVGQIRQGLPAGIRHVSVVKADGYGTGARVIAPVLKSAGAEMFAVANVAEAVELRQVEPGLPILLLSATLPEEDAFLFEYNLTPTVSTPEEVRGYQAAAADRDLKLPVHLKFDTGMGRLGIWHEQAEELFAAAATAPRLNVCGLYSHFASAGENPEFTRLQRQRFERLIERARSRFPSAWVHIDNSLGLNSLPEGFPINAVRIGLLQLGIVPLPAPKLNQFDVSPAVSLHSRVSVIKEMPRGSGISYGHTHILRRPSRIAVVTAGYADGILRAGSNRLQVLVRGRRCPVLGNVTMDETLVDVTDVPEPACGDRATFVGRQEGNEISMNEYSTACGTIPWEMLCLLGKRVARVYV